MASLKILRLSPTAGRTAAFAVLLLALLLQAGTSSSAAAADPSDGWSKDASFIINFLGRDGPNGQEHYRATLGYGASFFGIAVDSMPLVPALQAVAVLQDGYSSTFPGRPLDDIQPGDQFDFYLPVGTLVCNEWRLRGSVADYRSLQGDTLTVYADPNSAIAYRLIRADNQSTAIVKINADPTMKPEALAKVLFGQDDPSFKPDLIQVGRAADAIKNQSDTVTVDLSRAHLDDFHDILGQGEAGGKNVDGLDIYWFRSDQQAQPLFRVDDAIGDATAAVGLPSPMRIYYYKDGTVRTYQQADDATFLAGRQARTDDWTKVYADYGKVSPPPTHWELGQPEQDATAQALAKQGIVVLRYQRKEAPAGNFLTRLLDALFALMKRKES